jgi:hypothetical protein
MQSSNLHDQIELANRQIRHTKQSSPYLFPEYAELLEAKQAMKDAQERLKRAEAAWYSLGH